jgi:mRNA interferase YafQ
MIREIKRGEKFSADYKRVRRRLLDKGGDPGHLQHIAELLSSGQPLPARYQDHALEDEYSGYRDCHPWPDVDDDLVLIYRTTKKTVLLFRLGTHAELFNKSCR